MKKCILICMIVLMTTGCMEKGQNTILKEIEKNMNDLDSYHVHGEMQIINNEDKNLYDVDVSYAKEDQYRVSLKNQTNNHEQIILKNSDGVYVLTPTINKSFKFQSDWPYNNSQAYLLQNIIDDIKNDKEAKFTKKKNQYIFEVKAMYTNNQSLKKQRITFNKNYVIQKVEVLNDSGDTIITMNFKDVDLKANYKKDYFKLKSNMGETLNTMATSDSLDDVIYPMYIPENTKLTSQEKVKLKEGERVILTFSGDKEFTLIEETASVSDSNIIVPVSGDIEMVSDVYGYVTDNAISWISNGIEYYISSQDVDKDELLMIASSISMLPVSK